jgi:hypothetical protein
MFYPDGSWYDGEWLGDLKHGYGKYGSEDREVIECYWERNKPVI